MADEPDRATGLTGNAKIVSTIGVVGAFIVMFGYILQRTMEAIPTAIQNAIEAAADESAKNRAMFDAHLDKERERSERNRDHSAEHIKMVYKNNRENTDALIERIEKNGVTQQKVAEILKQILDQGKK